LKDCLLDIMPVLLLAIGICYPPIPY